MFGYPQLRKANISDEFREIFDRHGELGIQLLLIGGLPPGVQELANILGHKEYVRHALAWLTERADIRARKEWRLELVERFVLGFVFVGVVADFLLIFKFART